MDILKIYIFIYKLKKCVVKQVTGINITAIVMIFLLLSIVIFQQIYYPKQIENNMLGYKKHIEYLQFTFGNITNAFEDLKAEVEDFDNDKWVSKIKDIKLLIDNVDGKISYYESSIGNYYSVSRTKRQKLIF